MKMAAPSKVERSGTGIATREERRQALLAAVDAVAPVLSAEAPGAEAERHLTPAAITALQTSGLLALKLPLELGGFEADNALQYEVIERIAYHSTAAAWCMFIYTDILGKVASSLPDDGLAILLAGPELPLTCGGGGLIPGSLVPVDGGYRISGRWIYGSGNTGSDFFMVLGIDETGAQPEFKLCVVRSSEMIVDDNWHVVGMRGTGSSDYRADNAFIPSSMAVPFPPVPLRGGAIFQLGLMGYSAHTIASVAIGGTLRALDEIARMAETKARGYSQNKTPLARRGVFQTFLGRSRLSLMAMRAMMLEVGERIVADAERIGGNPLATEIESRAAASLATQTAVDIMSGILRYAGGEGARAGHPIERTMRDVQMAQTHFYISDSALELHGRSLLGETDLDAAS
ncbi:hypothetical protein SAMIE_1031590 [Sphingobium amiense]|uniref:Acyl-CoA dehydrogenase C-terminal domain-containing protein n=1 Tax=Sphingobium amiense TaxID=135719 RepID=A0A494W8Z9_9SPHN|nr:acyl-CoA dehydrogenase family protein [Sphingobium amiense]BBD99658.1 hypothetical protein SAMIE_1031590 [Sphingobium amiense]